MIYIMLVDNLLGGMEVVCKLWLLISWAAGIKSKFISGLGLLLKGDKKFLEPEVKTVEMLLVVGVLKLQEVGGLETSCLVDFVDLWFGSFHLRCLFKLAVLFLKL